MARLPHRSPPSLPSAAEQKETSTSGGSPEPKSLESSWGTVTQRGQPPVEAVDHPNETDAQDTKSLQSTQTTCESNEASLEGDVDEERVASHAAQPALPDKTAETGPDISNAGQVGQHNACETCRKSELRSSGFPCTEVLFRS